MRLEELVKSIRLKKFSGISSDSRRVKRNFIFVAVKGSKENGSKFIKAAVSKGAKVIVGQKFGPGLKLPKDVLFVPVADTRKAVAVLADKFFYYPSGKIKVVGVTGTNGKTTVTYLLEAILKKAGFIPAVIGTVNYRYKNKVIAAKNTTPGPIEIQSMLADMSKQGVDYLAMEVSSHALDQDRCANIDFHSAIFTNLTQDHLDYHKTIAKYFLSKSKLFVCLSKKSFCVINNDDKFASKLKKITQAKVITYGIDNEANVKAGKIEFGVNQTRFLLHSGSLCMRITTPLIGKHNVYNVLAVCAWALEAGIPQKKIKSAISNFDIVPGRLEPVNFRKDFSVFIDYAHTDDALKNVLTTLKGLGPNKIITVFGCGGERDKLKRPKMGRVVTELSDFAIITNDNPRSENPLKIVSEIKAGIRKRNYYVVLDRKKAIKKSLSLAEPGDIILIAGKGHETYQVLKNRTIPFNDKLIVRECLRSMN